MFDDFFYKTYHYRSKNDRLGMTLSEIGAYQTLIDLQFEGDRFTEQAAKKALGRPFYRHWNKMLQILKSHEGLYYIEWLDDAIYERQKIKKNKSDAQTDSWKIRNKIKEFNRQNRI